MSSPTITRSVTGTTGGPNSDGASLIMVPDTYCNPFNVGVGCVVSGSATYTVQHTFDDTLSPTFNPATANWFPNTGLTAQTTNANGNYAYPVNGIRVLVTAGTGTVTMSVLQAGTR